MASTLKKKTISGLLWSTFDSFGNTAISFGFGIFLARILSPDDYGLTAMIAVFLGISRIFIDSGFSNALIRKPELSDDDCSTAFYFNLLTALVCYVILFLSAPYIADFYDREILCSIVRVESICFVINSLVLVQTVLVNRRIDFKFTSRINFTASIVSGIVGIVLALRDFGVWALVYMNLSASLVVFLLYWLGANWRPQLVFSKDSFRYLFGFGSKILTTGILDVVFQNLYPIIIGKLFSSASLGYYAKANNFAKLPSTTLTNVIQRVTFPVLSLIQDDLERLSLNYRRLLRMSAFIIFPLMIGLAAVSKPLILLLLTSKWEQSAIYLQLLCLALMWYPIHAINLNLLQVKGRTDLFLKIELIKKGLLLLTILCTVPFGIIAMCVGLIVNSIISLFINTYYTGKIIGVGFFMQMKDLSSIMVNSLIMGAIAYFISLLFDNNVLSLLAAILVASTYYLVSSYVLRIEELRELLSYVRRRRI